jgi:hypothetical protein
VKHWHDELFKTAFYFYYISRSVYYLNSKESIGPEFPEPKRMFWLIAMIIIIIMLVPASLAVCSQSCELPGNNCEIGICVGDLCSSTFAAAGKTCTCPGSLFGQCTGTSNKCNCSLSGPPSKLASPLSTTASTIDVAARMTTSTSTLSSGSTSTTSTTLSSSDSTASSGQLSDSSLPAQASSASSSPQSDRQRSSADVSAGGALLGWHIGLIAAGAGLLVLALGATLALCFVKKNKKRAINHGDNNNNIRSSTLYSRQSETEASALSYDAPPSAVSVRSSYDPAPSELHYDAPGDTFIS